MRVLAVLLLAVVAALAQDCTFSDGGVDYDLSTLTRNAKYVPKNVLSALPP